MKANSGSEKAFGSLRSCFWPIHRHENRKLIPMLLMIFLIYVNYTILRNMKDSLVVTASGAETIPFIQVWAMFPMAILMTIFFSKLSKRFSQERIFYFMVSGFLTSFLLFAFILYPARDQLHPNELAKTLESILPAGCKGLISMFRDWTFTGFYVMAELWSSLILNVIFWGFANQVTGIGEAGRFYSIFGFGANLATMMAGQIVVFLSTSQFSTVWLFGERENWEEIQLMLISLITINGLLTMAIFRWMNKKVLNDPCFQEFQEKKQEVKTKSKFSFKESFSYLVNSKYLLCIAIVVVAYNLVINLAEIVWKDQLRQLYPDPNDLNNYLNNLTTIMGIISTITTLFMSKIISRLGWTKTALITPMIMFVTCTGFFLFLFFKDDLAGIVTLITGTTPLAIAVFFGGAQNCLSKAARYSVFDTTKEMAYIPLSSEYKLKGKAAIDGVGSRFGKSGGSLIYQGLLVIFSSLTATAPYVAAILMSAIFFWIGAAKSLGKQFNALVASKDSTSDLTPSSNKETELQLSI